MTDLKEAHEKALSEATLQASYAIKDLERGFMTYEDFVSAFLRAMDSFGYRLLPVEATASATTPRDTRSGGAALRARKS